MSFLGPINLNLSDLNNDSFAEVDVADRQMLRDKFQARFDVSNGRQCVNSATHGDQLVYFSEYLDVIGFPRENMLAKSGLHLDNIFNELSAQYGGYYPDFLNGRFIKIDSMNDAQLAEPVSDQEDDSLQTEISSSEETIWQDTEKFLDLIAKTKYYGGVVKDFTLDTGSKLNELNDNYRQLGGQKNIADVVNNIVEQALVMDPEDLAESFVKLGTSYDEVQNQISSPNSTLLNSDERAKLVALYKPCSEVAEQGLTPDIVACSIFNAAYVFSYMDIPDVSGE